MATPGFTPTTQIGTAAYSQELAAFLNGLSLDQLLALGDGFDVSGLARSDLDKAIPNQPATYGNKQFIPDYGYTAEDLRTMSKYRDIGGEGTAYSSGAINMGNIHGLEGPIEDTSLWGTRNLDGNDTLYEYGENGSFSALPGRERKGLNRYGIPILAAFTTAGLGAAGAFGGSTAVGSGTTATTMGGDVASLAAAEAAAGIPSYSTVAANMAVNGGNYVAGSSMPANLVGTGSKLDAAIETGVTNTVPPPSSTNWLDTAWGAAKSPMGQAVIGAGTSIYNSNKAADAARDASSVAAGAQASQLAYLKEINALPQQYKEEALRRLAGEAGLPGGEGSQSAIIEQARQSPLYQSIMGGQKAGEEAILRTGSATGMLRSGNTIDAIADDAEERQNNALLLSYQQRMGGLKGLAGLPTNETNIGNVMANIGNTEAQGITAGAQAKQYGIQGITDSLLSAGGNYERNRSI